MDIQPNEQKRIDKAGFKVTMAGSSYVVRHPSMRRKHEGGNLSAILTAAERDLEELEEKKKAKSSKAKANGAAPASALPGLSDPAKAKSRAERAAKAAERAKGGTTGGTTIADAVAGKNQPEPRPARATKTKRSQGDWKTYQIGKLILRNPAKTPEEILTLCKEQGIDTKIMTIVGLHRYFRLCLRVLADIAAEDQAKAPADG